MVSFSVINKKLSDVLSRLNILEKALTSSAKRLKKNSEKNSGILFAHVCDGTFNDKRKFSFIFLNNLHFFIALLYVSPSALPLSILFSIQLYKAFS